MSNQADQIPGLVQALNRLSLAIEGQNRRQDSEGWEVVSEAEGVTTSPALSLEERLAPVEYNDYEAFALLVPPCLAHLLRLCERLVEGQYSSEFRARRAWESGFWAALALQDRVRVPGASLPCDFKKTVYVVLRSATVQSPTRVSRVSDLYRLFSRINENKLAVFHGFASLAEAETYCESAGFRLPCQHSFQ